MYVYSVHMKLAGLLSLQMQEDFIARISRYLAEKYSIIESTIQITSQEGDVCNKEAER